MVDEKGSSKSIGTVVGTQVDLGDDLIEGKTSVISDVGLPLRGEEKVELEEKEPEDKFLDPSGGIHDLFQNARILLNENLVDDAKKVLRKILISDPQNFRAKDLLSEIQKKELKQILDNHEFRRPFGKKDETRLTEVDPDFLLRQLDSDLSLKIFEKSQGLQIPGLDENDQDKFCSALEKTLIEANVQDWVDLGIAFYEMDLFLIAARLLSVAYRRVRSQVPYDTNLALSATSLLALSLFTAGKSYEAISKIQPILRDMEIEQNKKIELFYLIGRIYEELGEAKEAFQHYKQVLELDPYYRDVEQRLRKRRS